MLANQKGSVKYIMGEPKKIAMHARISGIFLRFNNVKNVVILQMTAICINDTCTMWLCNGH